MSPDISVSPEQQQLARVAAHFDGLALYWKKIYELEGVFEAIHRQRRDRVFAMIGRLALAPGSRVLEIGCGAGSVAVELARQGHFVQATDVAPAMVALTGRSAVESGVEGRLSVSVADICSLTFPSSSFTLAIAMGVLPFVEPLDRAVAEMARVLKPGGYLLVNTDNRWRLNHVLDPFIGAGRLAAGALRRLGLRKPSQSAQVFTCSNRRFDDLLRSAHLVKLQSFTLGFGPFSFLTKQVVPRPAGLKLHDRLQSLADRGFPLIQSCGSQYIVLAKKLR
jgi:ubiquinone/menaquinone biosynthesis C-methylase UbiE